MGKLTGVDPVRPTNLQRRKVEVTDDQNNPIKPLKVTSNESKKNGENNPQIIMAACRPRNSSVFQTFKKAKHLKVIATTIKIKCSNNFPRQYSVEITYTSVE